MSELSSRKARDVQGQREGSMMLWDEFGAQSAPVEIVAIVILIALLALAGIAYALLGRMS